MRQCHLKSEKIIKQNFVRDYLEKVGLIIYTQAMKKQKKESLFANVYVAVQKFQKKKVKENIFKKKEKKVKKKSS